MPLFEYSDERNIPLFEYRDNKNIPLFEYRDDKKFRFLNTEIFLQNT